MNKSLMKKMGIVALLLGLAALFRVYHLEQYLSLDYVKGSQEQFVALYARHQVLVIGVCFLIYVIVTALSLPGAAVLTLAGGALFGFWMGTITVSFASEAPPQTEELVS